MGLNPPVPIALGRAEQLMSEGNQDILMEEVVGLFQQTAAKADVVIVEGLVHTPQQPYADQLNTTIAESLDAEIILVAALGHSSIHELDDRIEITARMFGGLDHPKVLGAIINKINVPRQPYLELGGGLTAANRPSPPTTTTTKTASANSAAFLSGPRFTCWDVCRGGKNCSPRARSTLPTTSTPKPSMRGIWLSGGCAASRFAPAPWPT
jgi:hypothetical protein